MRPRRLRLPVPAIALAIIMALGVAPAASQAADCPGADGLPLASSIAAAKSATLCLLNDARASQGIAPVSSDAVLERAAEGYSTAMVQQGFFAHVSPAGQVLDQRLAPYVSGAPVWDIGENLAWGEGALASPRAIVAGWMRSAPHRANILDARFGEIGIGIVNGSPVGSDTTSSATYTTEFGMVSTRAQVASARPIGVSAAARRRIATRCARVARRTVSTRNARSARARRCVRTRLRAVAAAAADR